MNEPELIRQVIQGGGNMPAYGNNLSPHEVKALVSYLVSLRPSNTIPAQNPAYPEKTDRASSSEPAKRGAVRRLAQRAKPALHLSLFA